MNIKDTLQLLGIQEVTTKQQKKNGTREFKLPVNCRYGGAIHVASFASGYVRRTKAGGYCPSWQINKRVDGEPEYFNSGSVDSLGRPMYTKFTTKSCKLIPKEVDRLEYLIRFCLKNYYVGYANMLSNGEFIPKWKYDMKNRYTWSCGQITDNENGDIYVHNQHAYWNKWKEEEDKPSSVEIIIDGHRYNVI